MDSLQVLNRGGTTKIEQVLSYTHVTSSVPLAGSDVGKRVFDGNAATQSYSPATRVLKVAKLTLKRFISGN